MVIYKGMYGILITFFYKLQCYFNGICVTITLTFFTVFHNILYLHETLHFVARISDYPNFRSLTNIQCKVYEMDEMTIAS